MKTKKCRNSMWVALASSQHDPPSYIPIAEARGITAILIILEVADSPLLKEMLECYPDHPYSRRYVASHPKEAISSNSANHKKADS